MGVEAGTTIRDARLRRCWSLRALADRAGVSTSHLAEVEAGAPASLETYARLMTAIDLQPRLEGVVQGRRRPNRTMDQDFVHAAMGEIEARRLASHGFEVAIDEPYQHYQFAGRADVLSVVPERRSLLHIENRTRFPDIQEMAGSYNAKRAYLARAVADRIGLRRGFVTVTHVMAGLWSAEVQHLVRIRTATFRSLCPDGPDAFESWLGGAPPDSGVTSAFVLLDPRVRPRARRWIDLDAALKAEPRYRGYADAVAAMSPR